jgi:hypothetical protein
MAYWTVPVEQVKLLALVMLAEMMVLLELIATVGATDG